MHFIVCVVLCCGTLVLGAPDGLQGRINNGKPVDNNNYPFMAVVHTLWSDRICGGTILNENWVLTSARCAAYFNVGDVISYGTLRLNETYKYVTMISKLVIHPNYNNNNLQNDLALLRTGNPIELREDVQPVTLSKNPVKPDDSLQVIGWGQVMQNGKNSNDLQWKNVTSTEVDICREELPDAVLNDQMQVCTFGTRGGGGGCTGDQGGPLLSFPSLEQVGIMSFGGECGSGKPTVNTRIEPYVEWIESKIKE